MTNDQPGCTLCSSQSHARAACPWAKVHGAFQVVILVALFCAPMLYGALMDADRELQEAQEVTAAQHSRDFAARKVCGENAAWQWVSDTELQCFTHRGHRTGGRVLVASMNASK